MVNKKNGTRKKRSGKKPPPPATQLVDFHNESPVGGDKSIPSQQQADDHVSEGAIVGLTRALVWWTGFLAVATAVLGITAIFQWRELHKTDETLRQTLVVNQRPWVDLKVFIDGPFSINDKIAYFAPES